MILQTYLGLDLGTSEFKALLMGSTGEVLGTVGIPLTCSYPKAGWSEQDPAQWVQAMIDACRDLKQQQPIAYAAVQGIGLSGQMHGATLLNADNEVLRPCILWNDTRSGLECTELTQRCPALKEITGNLAMPGFTAPKILWLQHHEPDVFAKIAKVLLPKDYLRWILTGDYVSDMSDAAGTLWLDVANRSWSEPMLAATGLHLSQMPRLVESTDLSGRLNANAAQLLNLPENLPIAGGAGDNAASAIGLGAIHPGEGFVSLGTSGVIYLVTDRYSPNPEHAVHAFCHALPNSWHQMAVMLSAASCLKWITQITGYEDETALLKAVAELAPAALEHAPLFLPYLSGERTPHNNADASGVFFGLRHTHQAADLAFSVMEGVGFGLLDCLNALRTTSSNVVQLQLVGGGARSPIWAQLLADILQIRIATSSTSAVGAALGAARLGQLAHEANDHQAIARICTPAQIDKLYLPDPHNSQKLQARHARFTNLYRALRSEF